MAGLAPLITAIVCTGMAGQASAVEIEPGVEWTTVVRESGLSVGAIYTYFSGKDELIRLSCDQIATRALPHYLDYRARLLAQLFAAEGLVATEAA